MFQIIIELLERFGEIGRVFGGSRCVLEGMGEYDEFPGVRKHLGAFGLGPERFGALWSILECLGAFMRVRESPVEFRSVL